AGTPLDRADGGCYTIDMTQQQRIQQAENVRARSFIIRTVSLDTRDLFINRLIYTGRYPMALEVSEQTTAIRLSVEKWFEMVQALRDGDPINEDHADAIQDMLFHHGWAE